MKKIAILSTLLALILSINSAVAQYGEPEIQSIESPKNLFDEGYKTGFGIVLGLNDFGFGAGIQFRKGLSSYTEGLFNLKIAGLRDPSEQTYIDYYFGSRTIPSKYRRVVTIPATIGLKRRVFAREISDNFRVHTSMSFGPVLAFSIPYFNDANNSGYREESFELGGYRERVYDVFQGWKESETEFGWNGEVVLGIDFGENFAKLQTFQLGYSFYYFGGGIQILEPNEPLRNQFGQIIDTNPRDTIPDFYLEANGPSKYFGSAQITFIFGWMW